MCNMSLCNPASLLLLQSYLSINYCCPCGLQVCSPEDSLLKLKLNCWPLYGHIRVKR